MPERIKLQLQTLRRRNPELRCPGGSMEFTSHVDGGEWIETVWLGTTHYFVHYHVDPGQRVRVEWERARGMRGRTGSQWVDEDIVSITYLDRDPRDTRKGP
jgi:hypothetical protein